VLEPVGLGLGLGLAQLLGRLLMIVHYRFCCWIAWLVSVVIKKQMVHQEIRILKRSQ
jgi:hypothetical protein